MTRFTAADAPKASFIDDPADAAMWARYANAFHGQNNHPAGARRMADEAMKRKEARESAKGDPDDAPARRPGMPWRPEDAERHTHLADTPKKQRQWAHISNGVLKAGGTDKRAIMEANGVLKRETDALADGGRVGPPFQREMVAKGRFHGLVGRI
jgi:hypothetical protein